MRKFTRGELREIFALFFDTTVEEEVMKSLLTGQPQELPKSNIWEVALARYGPAEWKGLFRLPREVFQAVVKKISSHKVFRIGKNVGCRAIPVDKQLACLMMRCGMHTVQNVRTILGVSKEVVCGATFRCIQAIQECYPDSIVMASEGSLKEMRLKQYADRGFKGAVATVDVVKVGVVVETEVAKAGQKDRFADRNHEIVQSYQVCGTPDYKVVNVYGGHGGPVSDITIWNESPLMKNLKKYVGPGQFIMGDMGYTLREYLLSGYRLNDKDRAPIIPSWQREGHCT